MRCWDNGVRKPNSAGDRGSRHTVLVPEKPDWETWLVDVSAVFGRPLLMVRQKTEDILSVADPGIVHGCIGALMQRCNVLLVTIVLISALGSFASSLMSPDCILGGLFVGFEGIGVFQ